MNNLKIIDSFVDDREFRNYIVSILPKLGFENITIDDTRVSDSDAINDNDIKAYKSDMRYTIQTFLNRNITKKEIDETIEDMINERVSYAAIVTNKNVDKDVIIFALEHGIDIIDREILCTII